MSVIKEKPLSCGAERLWVSSVGTDRDLMIVCRNHRCTVYQLNPPGTLASVRRGGMAEKTAKCEAYVKRGSLI